MKIWSKVKLKGEKNAEHLIRAFFENFNPKNSIIIKGKEAKVEVFFNKPPQKIVDAISYCEVLEFNCKRELTGEENSEQVEQEEETFEQVEQEEEIAEQVEQEEETFEQVEQEEETSEQVEQEEETFEQVEQEEETSEQVEQEEEIAEQAVQEEENSEKEDEISKPINSNKKQELEEIPELIQISKQVTSYEEFVQYIAEWLGLDKRKEFFENSVKAAEQDTKITWRKIKEILNSNKFFYTDWDQIFCGKQVTAKFKDSKYSVTILKLIKEIVKYKNFDFNQPIETEETIKAEAVIPKKRVKMECMPEIPAFEEVLESVDKSQPIEERVRKVLTVMGLNEKNAKDQNIILEITNAAVKTKENSFDGIFAETNLSAKDLRVNQMTLSQFINDFVRRYRLDKKVKTLDFLKDLQSIVMLDSEIEN